VKNSIFLSSLLRTALPLSPCFFLSFFSVFLLFCRSLQLLLQQPTAHFYNRLQSIEQSNLTSHFLFFFFFLYSADKGFYPCLLCTRVHVMVGPSHGGNTDPTHHDYQQVPLLSLPHPNTFSFRRRLLHL
jgi:hypothetical protein